ncbi:MAG: hypothetical protein IJ590_04700, partial [Rickettsiales bacterium]|nr:hypothetical protein [Rickettsiales bacterium]
MDMSYSTGSNYGYNDSANAMQYYPNNAQIYAPQGQLQRTQKQKRIYSSINSGFLPINYSNVEHNINDPNGESLAQSYGYNFISDINDGTGARLYERIESMDGAPMDHSQQIFNPHDTGGTEAQPADEEETRLVKNHLAGQNIFDVNGVYKVPGKVGEYCAVLSDGHVKEVVLKLNAIAFSDEFLVQPQQQQYEYVVEQYQPLVMQQPPQPQYLQYVPVQQPQISVVPSVTTQQPQPAPTYTPTYTPPDNTTEYDTTDYVEPTQFVEGVRNEEIPVVDTTMVRDEEEKKTNNIPPLEPPKVEDFVVTDKPIVKQPKRVKAKIGTKPKAKKVKKVKPEPKDQKTENFNIRVGDNLGVGADVQPAPTAQKRSETPQTINVFIPREKKVDDVKTLQENITATIKPQDIQEQISVNFNEAKLLDNIKALLAKQGTNNVKQIIDIVDHIKIDPKVPREHIQLFENLSVQLHELANKIPGNVTFEYNNEDVIKEIATIREKIDNIKIPEHKGDNISVELNHLEAVDEKLKLIEDKLEGFKKPSVANISDEINVELNGYDEFAKLVSELKTDVKNLQEKEAGIIVESPDIQEITDKLTVLLEEKLKNINSKDNISIEQPNVIVETQDISGAIDEMKKMMVNIEDNLMLKFEQKLKEQKMPAINVEVPQNNVNIDDQISVSNNDAAPIVVEVPAESTPKDYIDQVLQDVILQGQQGENSDLMLNVIQELKAEIQALKEQDVVVEVPVQDISINDEIEVDQQTQEKGKKEEIIENVYEEVDKPVKKEENEAVIIDEHTEISEPKKEETIQMPAAPTPMSGFMTAQMMPMMMPPVFMPPPMPMATPAQQPQQPIVITQNQSDEEEGNDFWSTFLK